MHINIGQLIICCVIDIPGSWIFANCLWLCMWCVIQENQSNNRRVNKLTGTIALQKINVFPDLDQDI